VALPVYGEFLRSVVEDGSLGVTKTDTFFRPMGAKEYDCWDGSITIEDVERESEEGTEPIPEEKPSDVIFEEDDEFF
jgi:hypothetical protein